MTVREGYASFDIPPGQDPVVDQARNNSALNRRLSSRRITPRSHLGVGTTARHMAGS
jgi:hypothetical protein